MAAPGGVEWISRSRPSGLRSGQSLPAPGRTLPAPAEALRCPENADSLLPDGTTAVPGPDPPFPASRRPRLSAICAARARPSLRRWPVLHFGLEVGASNRSDFADWESGHIIWTVAGRPLCMPPGPDRQSFRPSSDGIQLDQMISTKRHHTTQPQSALIEHVRPYPSLRIGGGFDRPDSDIVICGCSPDTGAFLETTIGGAYIDFDTELPFASLTLYESAPDDHRTTQQVRRVRRRQPGRPDGVGGRAIRCEGEPPGSDVSVGRLPGAVFCEFGRKG